MLRKSLLEVGQYSWEPTIPTEAETVAQVVEAAGKVSGSLKLSMAQVAVKLPHLSATMKLMRKCNLVLRGTNQLLSKKFKGLA